MCGESKIRQWNGCPVYSLSKNIKVKFNHNKLSTPVYSSGKKISEVLKSERPDVIHVQMPYSPLMAQRVINKARKYSVIIGTFHVLPSGRLSRVGTKILRLIQHQSLRKIDKKISVSGPAQQFAEECYGIKSIIIPNMVDLRRLNLKHRPEINKNEIVFLGRLVKRKGCEELIRTFKLLSTQNPEARLTIAGAGPEEIKLKRLVYRLGISDKVKFLGYISELGKAGLLARAQIACFPSLYGESFGIVLIEAMAAGAKTILGGDNPGYESILREKKSMLVDPTDTPAFAIRLERFLTDDKLATEIHSWQQENVGKYDVNVVGQQLLDIYNQEIAKKSINKA